MFGLFRKKPRQPEWEQIELPDLKSADKVIGDFATDCQRKLFSPKRLDGASEVYTVHSMLMDDPAHGIVLSSTVMIGSPMYNVVGRHLVDPAKFILRSVVGVDSDASEETFVVSFAS